MTTIRPHNRVAPLLTPQLPATAVERQVALADAVFAALLALQQQLSHPDAAVVREAAAMILDFEKTRLRHDRPVAGTEQAIAATGGCGVADAAPAGRGEEEDDEQEFEHYVERVRRDLEGMKGTNGIPDVITREFAEQVARHTRDPDVRRAAGMPPNAQ